MTEPTIVDDKMECGHRAVTENVPKSFMDALRDPIWSSAARKEWDLLLETKSIMEVDSLLAKDLIREGADLVPLFPIYEVKDDT